MLSSKHVFSPLNNAQRSFTHESFSQVHIIRAASDDHSEEDEWLHLATAILVVLTYQEVESGILGRF